MDNNEIKITPDGLIEHVNNEIVAGHWTPTVKFPDMNACKALAEIRIRFWCPVCLSEFKETFTATELEKEQHLFLRHIPYNSKTVCIVSMFALSYRHPQVSVRIWNPYYEEETKNDLR